MSCSHILPSITLLLYFKAVHKIFGLFADGVIGQVGEVVLNVVGVVVLGAKPAVALVVNPDFERVPWIKKGPVGDEHPDPQVELAVLDGHGVLQVLLHDPAGVLDFDVVEDLHEVVEEHDSSSAREPEIKIWQSIQANWGITRRA